MFTFYRAPLALALTLTVALSVAGCATPDDTAGSPSTSTPKPSVSSTPSQSATPTSEPAVEVAATTPPALSSVELSTGGLGTIVLGQPMPAEGPASMATYDPTYCTDAGYSVPDAGAWLANYPTVNNPARDVATAFDVATVGFTQDGAVGRIFVLSPEITTAEGIHVGSTEAELLAAYPNYNEKIEGDLSNGYSVRGTDGQLMFEIAKNSVHPGYWPADFDGKVVWISALADATHPLYITAGSDAGGFCQTDEM